MAGIRVFGIVVGVFFISVILCCIVGDGVEVVLVEDFIEVVFVGLV